MTLTPHNETAVREFLAPLRDMPLEAPRRPAASRQLRPRRLRTALELGGVVLGLGAIMAVVGVLALGHRGSTTQPPPAATPHAFRVVLPHPGQRWPDLLAVEIVTLRRLPGPLHFDVVDAHGEKIAGGGLLGDGGTIPAGSRLTTNVNYHVSGSQHGKVVILDPYDDYTVTVPVILTGKRAPEESKGGYDPPKPQNPGSKRMKTGIFHENLNTAGGYRFAVQNSWVGYSPTTGDAEVICAGAVTDGSPHGIVLITTIDPKTGIPNGSRILRAPGSGGALTITRDNGDNTIDLVDAHGRAYRLDVGTRTLTPR